MRSRSKVTLVCSVLLVLSLASSAFISRAVIAERGSQATLEEVLYLPSGKVLRRASLGYSSLLADIYWTRAVQYFGSRHLQHSMRYDLLSPLLEITTDLDPHLLVAYQSGSIFLTQKPPEGAGQPEKAVALLEKGIRENPNQWQLYFSLGFVHYLDRRDYKAAQDAFESGSELPGAHPWLKTMAARMAEKADDMDTALSLWQAIYDSNQEPVTRDTALKHIASLRAEAQISELQRRTASYRERTGSWPANWMDMAHAGLLNGIPVDPTGDPYQLGNDGSVHVEHPDRFPFLGEFEQRRQK